MIEIRTADAIKLLHISIENDGRISGGKPLGTSPTTLTPLAARSNPQTIKVVATIAATGPAFATMPAKRCDIPNSSSRGSNPLRTQNRNPVAVTPITAVIQLICDRLWASDPIRSGSVWPCVSIPRMCFNWLAAMMRPDAVMNPAITGWDRKLAKNPKRNSPKASKIRPDRKANVMAARIYSDVPGTAILLTAATVNKDTTATGPTASARLVPNTA